ncbi:NnrS family protein [Pseudoxanthobacter sp. M-2]|uniref:NnrS family protein n=1 Tax=Pseudoxanthobacter sp. M-2 TaxID=3078754 RepID=UPI0038FD3A79
MRRHRPLAGETGTGRHVANRSIPFISQGFRPFFMIAGLWAPLGVVVWMLALAGMPVPDGPLALSQWHAHELLAGFVGATMIGFVLTAIPNWTKGPPYAGAPLVGLFALFLAARLALLPGSPIPIWLAAPLALAAVPAALLLVLPALLRAGSPRLFGPPALILLFWAGDLLMLGEAAGWWSAATWPTGQRLMANVALLLVGLIGGRIIPTFTLNALRAAGTPVEVRPLPGIDAAAILSLLAVVLVDVVWPESPAAGAVAAVTAVLLALRLSRWHGLRTLRAPILWILHVAYALVALALALKAACLLLGADWAVNWLHLQVAGALATMILAMMTRATLGHTGRPLVATAATVAAYVLLLGAVVLRVAGPVVVEDTVLPLVAATVCWAASFTFFLGAYAPMLVGPRVNGGAD